jgi:hypothetical protein
MSFSETEQRKIPFKALAGNVLGATAARAWYEEILPFDFVLPKQRVWVESGRLKALPAANLAAAQSNASSNTDLIEDLSAAVDAVRLSPDPGGSAQVYVAYSTYNDPDSAVIGNWIKPQFVPQASGLPSVGYAIRLYDGDPNSGGTEVLTTEGQSGSGENKSVGWVFNYDSGTLLLSATFATSISDPYVLGFRYVGATSGVSGTTPFVVGKDASLYPYTSVADAVADAGARVTATGHPQTVYITGCDFTDPYTVPGNLLVLPNFVNLVGEPQFTINFRNSTVLNFAVQIGDGIAFAADGSNTLSNLTWNNTTSQPHCVIIDNPGFYDVSIKDCRMDCNLGEPILAGSDGGFSCGVYLEGNRIRGTEDNKACVHFFDGIFSIKNTLNLYNHRGTSGTAIGLKLVDSFYVGLIDEIAVEGLPVEMDTSTASLFRCILNALATQTTLITMTSSVLNVLSQCSFNSGGPNVISAGSGNTVRFSSAEYTSPVVNPTISTGTTIVSYETQFSSIATFP